MFTKDNYDGDDGIGSPRNEKCQYDDKKVQGCLALLSNCSAFLMGTGKTISCNVKKDSFINFIDLVIAEENDSHRSQEASQEDNKEVRQISCAGRAPLD